MNSLPQSANFSMMVLTVVTSTGVPTAPGAPPTVTLTTGGTGIADVSGTVATVTNLGTGIYLVSFPLAAFFHGTSVQVQASWTVTAVAHAQLDSVYVQ
jgi:hypothetical protein